MLDHDLNNSLALFWFEGKTEAIDDQLSNGLFVVDLFLKIVHVYAVAGG